MNSTCAVIGCCLWSIRVQIHGWHNLQETCFLCFAKHGKRFWKYLWDNFRLISKWKPGRKFSRSYLQRRKMEKWRQKEFLTTWECLNCKKFSQQLPMCVITTRDSLFCKTFSPFFCLIEQVKTLKNFSKKLYISKIKQKKRGDDKSSIWDLKNA